MTTRPITAAGETDATQQALRDAVSPDRLVDHLVRFSELFRDSGTEDERVAADYLVSQLRGFGLEPTTHTFDSWISWPREGTLRVQAGDEVLDIAVRTRSFGARTDGLDAELIHVPFAAPARGEMIFSHRAVAADYRGLDVTGKIVITGDGGPDGIRRAQEHGAVAHIHVWPSDEDAIHEMIATPVWGTPTPETAQRVPKIPALGLSHGDGLRLGELLAVLARLVAAQRAALLEMARVFAGQREALRHGLRFAWWPGHSTGRYSGSTWYADAFFDDLHAHALGYVNIDSPGPRGAAVWDCRYNCGEIEAVMLFDVEDLLATLPSR